MNTIADTTVRSTDFANVAISWNYTKLMWWFYDEKK